MDRLRAWLRSRPYRRLWRSLPALVAGVACAGFAFVLVRSSPEQTSAHYASLVDRALAAHDFNTARVASQRRLELGFSARPETLFKLAESLDGLGDHQQSLAIMNLLAPGDHPGYAPAHLVLAETLLRHRQLTAPVIRAVELHLAYANQLESHSPVAQAMLKFLSDQFQAWNAGKTNHLKLDPNALETHEVAGWVFFQNQNWAAAKPHLLAEVAYNPSVNFMLADLATATGDQEGVRHWSEQAASVYRDKLAKDHGDEPGDRLAWVQAEVRLGQYDTARQILENGEKLSGTNVYGPAIAEFYAAWAVQLAQTQPGNLAARLHCIQQGLAADSFNSSLIQQLAALSHLNGPEAKTAGGILDNLLAEGTPAAQRLSILGMAAWQHGEQDVAQSYMRRAYKLSPNLPDVVNNMAVMLALSDQPKLDEALQLVQSLLKKYPEQPHFRDTRGQIYILLGRYEEGVADLEFALPRLTNPENTEKNLGRAYRLLAARNGNQKYMDLAIHYEKLAAQSNQPVH